MLFLIELFIGHSGGCICVQELRVKDGIVSFEDAVIICTLYRAAQTVFTCLISMLTCFSSKKSFQTGLDLLVNRQLIGIPLTDP